MEKLKITKDNYKEYVDLYVKRCDAINLKTYALIVCGTGIIFLIGGLVFLNDTFLKGISLGLALLIAPGSGLIYEHMALKKTSKKVKKKYPKVNIDYTQEELKEALIDEKILQMKNGARWILNVKEYEQKIKCDEIKGETFDKFNHDYSNLEYASYISEEEISKNKIKVKKLIRTGKK